MSRAGTLTIVVFGVLFPSRVFSQGSSISTLRLLDQWAQGTRSSVPPKPKIPKAQPVPPAIGNNSLKALVARVIQPKNLVKNESIGRTVYNIYTVSTRNAVKGQGCPSGAYLDNTVFVVKPAEGLGRDFYPIRIRAMCSNSKDLLGLVTVNLDWDGNILETPVIESKNPEVHPWCDKVTVKSSKNHDFSPCLNRLVQLFLSVR